MAHNFKKGDRVIVPDGRRGAVSIIFPNSTIVEVLLDDDKYVYPLLVDLQVPAQYTHVYLNVSSDRIADLYRQDKPDSLESHTIESVPDATGYPHDDGPQLPASILADGCDSKPEVISSSCKACLSVVSGFAVFQYECPATQDGLEVEIFSARREGFMFSATAEHALSGIRAYRRAHRD